MKSIPPILLSISYIVLFLDCSVYVVDESGKFAVRHPIRIGRQNPQYYEVTEGLKPGDRVIVSGYELFGNNEKLILK